MNMRLMGQILNGIVALTLLASPWQTVVAKEGAPPLYAATIAKYPAPKLADVDGREYKILFDPAKTSPDMGVAFKDLWDKIKAAAAKQGMQVTEKDKNPLAIEFSTKEYFRHAGSGALEQGLPDPDHHALQGRQSPTTRSRSR
jgi:hypothetical protein